MVSKKIFIILAIAILLLICSLFLNIADKSLVGKNTSSDIETSSVQGNPDGSINLVIMPNENSVNYNETKLFAKSFIKN